MAKERKVHAQRKDGKTYLPMCGLVADGFTTALDPLDINCKKCLRLMDKYTSYPAAEQLMDVVVTSNGGNRINVIKVVREVTNLGLREAKEFSDQVFNARMVLLAGVSYATAELVSAKLQVAGAGVEILPHMVNAVGAAAYMHRDEPVVHYYQRDADRMLCDEKLDTFNATGTVLYVGVTCPKCKELGKQLGKQNEVVPVLAPPDVNISVSGAQYKRLIKIEQAYWEMLRLWVPGDQELGEINDHRLDPHWVCPPKTTPKYVDVRRWVDAGGER